MHKLFFVLLLNATMGLFAQTGPGGIGTIDGSGSLKIWYRVDNGLVLTGTTVDSIRNSVAVPALSIGETGAQRPTLVAGAVNGFGEISFSGSNRLRTGLTLTTGNFIVDEASSFVVSRADNTTQTSCVYTTDPLVGTTRFTNHIPWSNTVYNDIGTCCGTSARIEVSGLTGLTAYSVWSYDALPATGKQLYRDGTLLQNRASTTTYSSHATQRFNIGGNTSGTNGFEGDVTEIIVFREKVNTAQRIIIENYLAAKYGIVSASNDLYNEDDPAAGNYDFNVAGIGRVDASNLQDNSRGTGLIQILNATDLGNDEFLIWGHNSGVYEAIEFSDVPAPVVSRFERVWRASEVNASGTAVDVGAVDIRWDLAGLGYIDPTHLRLIVDTDNDGLFSDETPIGGAIDLGGDSYAFEGVTAIENNLRFTLGTINSGITQLPIELVEFNVRITDDCQSELIWKTKSEVNNDFFLLQRSTNGSDWDGLTQIRGQGNSNVETVYAWTDASIVNDTYYYRIVQTDFDGKSTIYYANKVNAVTCAETFIYPNPTSDFVTFFIGSTDLSAIQLVDLCGKQFLIHDAVIEHENGNLTLDVRKLAAGTYLILLPNGSHQRFVKVFN